MESDKMDEELDEVILGYDEECSRSSVLLELRELQLQAYASLVDAVRASGKLDEAKKNFMMEVRKYFDISDERHQIECKRASLDPHLTRIAERLTGVDLKTSWRLEGTRTFPEPPLFRRMCRDLQELCRNCVKIPLPVCNEPISTSVSDAEAERDENSATENEVDKSQVPRTNTLPPKSVPAVVPQPTAEVEISADDTSDIAISVSFDPSSAMEITADGDKNSIKTVPPQDLLTNITDVKYEVLLDENNISNHEEQVKVSTKPESSNVEQDLKVKEENIENNIPGISPFLVSLLQERRNNSKPLDPRMSLLNYTMNSGNQKEIVDYEVVNGEEFGMAEKRWYQLEHRREQGVQTMPVSIVEENEEYSSCEDDEELDYYNIKRERSPDITDTPTSTPLKQRLSSLKSSTNTKKGRGAKRKLVRRPSKVELPPVAKKVLKNAKQSKQVKNNKQLPKIKMFSKRRSSTDNEDEDVQMEPKEKSTVKVGRGRGLSKVRGRGTGRGRGHGRGRPPLNSNPASHGSVASLMDSSNLLPAPQFDPAAATLKSPSPSRSPHLPSPSKPNIHNSGSTTKPLKAMKAKKNKTVSCSRRKSSLKAKEDDEMQVTWDDHDYEGAVIVRGNNLIPIRKRRSVSSNDTSAHSGDEHRRKERIYLNESPEDQYWNRGIIKRRISTNTGDDEDPDSLPFNDEETDSASENESERGEHHTPPGQNNNSTSNPHRARKSSPSPPVQHPSAIHKQRLTTPTKMNSNTPGGGSQAQLPRITLPPPVFSTTLNETRAPKPVSVVDSLNLHLPITPTASSLAASSVVRRTPTVGGASSSSSSTGGSGCGIFSNSQALIANSRGTPGILQKQRKAQPHILSNSKAHQRTFIPTSNPSQNADNYTGETDYLILTLPNNL